jgi:hypothetical protein
MTRIRLCERRAPLIYGGARIATFNYTCLLEISDVQIGEGTHTVIMEKNRMQLFSAVQQFWDEKFVAGK